MKNVKSYQKQNQSEFHFTEPEICIKTYVSKIMLLFSENKSCFCETQSPKHFGTAFNSLSFPQVIFDMRGKKTGKATYVERVSFLFPMSVISNLQSVQLCNYVASKHEFGVTREQSSIRSGDFGVVYFLIKCSEKKERKARTCFTLATNYRQITNELKSSSCLRIMAVLLIHLFV